MKNSLCEKIMWYVLSPTIFQFIKQYWKDIDIKNVKRISKRNYKTNDMTNKFLIIRPFIVIDLNNIYINQKFYRKSLRHYSI